MIENIKRQMMLQALVPMASYLRRSVHGSVSIASVVSMLNLLHKMQPQKILCA